MHIRRVSLRNASLFGELAKVDFTSDLVVLAGVNGSGKSTLLRVLGFLLGIGSISEDLLSRVTKNRDFRATVLIDLSRSVPETIDKILKALAVDKSELVGSAKWLRVSLSSKDRVWTRVYQIRSPSGGFTLRHANDPAGKTDMVLGFQKFPPFYAAPASEGKFDGIGIDSFVLDSMAVLELQVGKRYRLEEVWNLTKPTHSRVLFRNYLGWHLRDAAAGLSEDASDEQKLEVVDRAMAAAQDELNTWLAIAGVRFTIRVVFDRESGFIRTNAMDPEWGTRSELKIPHDVLLSEGTQRALGIPLLLTHGMRMERGPILGVVAIDEVERGLHPAVQVGMLNYLRDHSKSRTVIVTTHSSTILTAAKLNELYLTDVGPSKVAKILPAMRDRGFVRLIDAEYRALGGGVFGGVAPILIVEGLTDRRYIEMIQIDREAKEIAGLTLVHARSATNVKATARFYSEAGHKSICLFDSDQEGTTQHADLSEDIRDGLLANCVSLTLPFPGAVEDLFEASLLASNLIEVVREVSASQGLSLNDTATSCLETAVLEGKKFSDMLAIAWQSTDGSERLAVKGRRARELNSKFKKDVKTELCSRLIERRVPMDDTRVNALTSGIGEAVRALATR